MKFRKTFFVLFFLLSAQGFAQTPMENSKSKFYEILYVVDGDTFWYKNEQGEKEKVRLIGIDAPEAKNYFQKQKQYFGVESTLFLRNFLKGKKVRLEYDVQRLDRYQRTLAYVFMEDGTFLNDFMIRNGYAVAATFPPNVKHQNQFLKSERVARKNNLGMWNISKQKKYDSQSKKMD